MSIKNTAFPLEILMNTGKKVSAKKFAAEQFLPQIHHKTGFRF
jgi:hypothetical protein